MQYRGAKTDNLTPAQCSFIFYIYYSMFAKTVFSVLIFFSIATFIYPEQHNNTSINNKEQNKIYRTFSFDISYLIHGLSNNGIGIGTNHEQYTIDHISAIVGLHGTIVKTNLEETWCTTVGVVFSGSYYPFCRDLRKLFFNFGLGTDLLLYHDNSASGNTDGAAVISFKNNIGWRYSVTKELGIDIFTGYTFLFPATPTRGDIYEYIGNGIQAGVSLKKVLKTEK